MGALELRLSHLHLIVLLVKELHELDPSLKNHHLFLNRHAHHLENAKSDSACEQAVIVAVAEAHVGGAVQVVVVHVVKVGGT